MDFILSLRISRALKCDDCNMRHKKGQCTRIQNTATIAIACAPELKVPVDNDSDPKLSSFDSNELEGAIQDDPEQKVSVAVNPVAEDGLHDFCPLCPPPSVNNNYKLQTKLNKKYRELQACATCFKRTKGIVKPKLSGKIRDALWEHYFGDKKNALCLGCELKTMTVSGTAGWEAAHIVATAKDGGNDIDNLLPMCAGCNSSNSTNTVHKDIVEKYHAFRIKRQSPHPLTTDDRYCVLGNRLEELNNLLCDLSLANAVKIAQSESLWADWKAAQVKNKEKNIFAVVLKDGSIKFGAV